MFYDDIQELSQKHICSSCIGDNYLCNLIENERDEHECDYCGNLAPAMSLEELAERVETAFASHFSRTANEPDSFQYAMLKDKEIDYDWERRVSRQFTPSWTQHKFPKTLQATSKKSLKISMQTLIRLPWAKNVNSKAMPTMKKSCQEIRSGNRAGAILKEQLKLRLGFSAVRQHRS